MTFEIDSINVDINVDDIVDKVLDTISDSCSDSIFNSFPDVEDFDDFICDNEDELNKMLSFVIKQIITKLSKLSTD